MTGMVTDRNGRHEVLLQINQNRYNFQEKQMQSFFVKKLLIPKIQTSGKYRKHRHSLMLQLRPFWKIPSLVG